MHPRVRGCIRGVRGGDKTSLSKNKKMLTFKGTVTAWFLHGTTARSPGYLHLKPYRVNILFKIARKIFKMMSTK